MYVATPEGGRSEDCRIWEGEFGEDWRGVNPVRVLGRLKLQNCPGRARALWDARLGEHVADWKLQKTLSPSLELEENNWARSARLGCSVDWPQWWEWYVSPLCFTVNMIVRFWIWVIGLTFGASWIIPHFHHVAVPCVMPKCMFKFAVGLWIEFWATLVWWSMGR